MSVSLPKDDQPVRSDWTRAEVRALFEPLVFEQLERALDLTRQTGRGQLGELEIGMISSVMVGVLPMMRDDGKTSGGCWIYTGVYTDAGNMSMRRDASDHGLEQACTTLLATRPTAVNLFWAIERMKRVAEANSDKGLDAIQEILKEEAIRIEGEQVEALRQWALGRTVLA